MFKMFINEINYKKLIEMQAKQNKTKVYNNSINLNNQNKKVNKIKKYTMFKK